MNDTSGVPSTDPVKVSSSIPIDADADADDRPVPERLLALLDRLGGVLAVRGDAVALLGLGSVGTELDRLDEHSDADFFVVARPGQVRRYLDDLDWLEATAPVAWTFAHTHDGRKVLFADGLFAEYAVFTLDELNTISFHSARVVWASSDAPDGLTEPGVPLPALPTVAHQVGEAVTNLFIGLHRDLRGERLAATRFVQGHAVDRLITVLDLLGVGDGPAPQVVSQVGSLGQGDRVGAGPGQRDPYAVERRVEQRRSARDLPLAELVPGYGAGRNAAAALVVLDLLERHTRVDPAIASRIRTLAARAAAVTSA